MADPQRIAPTPGRIPLQAFGAEAAGLIERRSKNEDWLGIFAVQPLSRGALIFPRWHDLWKHVPGWRDLTMEEISALPGEQRNLALRYGLDIDFGHIAAPQEERFVTTLDNFLNHSCEPNLGYDFEGNVITTREISSDEELTIDYGCFSVNFDEPWECRCGAPSCRGQIRNTDWQQLAKRHGLAMPGFLRARIAQMAQPSPS